MAAVYLHAHPLLLLFDRHILCSHDSCYTELNVSTCIPIYYFVIVALIDRLNRRSRKKENKRSYLIMIISICFMFLLSTALVTLDATSRIAPNTSNHTNQFVLAQTIIFSFQVRLPFDYVGMHH